MSFVLTRNEFRVKGKAIRDTFEHLAGQRAPAASRLPFYVSNPNLYHELKIRGERRGKQDVFKI
jgi:hypothetical protein